MPRYHHAILAVEGECSMCGNCCRECHRLTRKGAVWICKDHPDRKPSHCVMFPIGYAVELLPATCTLRPTVTVRLDETVHTGRTRVSGRTGLTLFHPLQADEDGEEDKGHPSLYDVQGRIEAELEEQIYGHTPKEILQRIRNTAKQLVMIEDQHEAGGDAPLSWEAAKEAEELLKGLFVAAMQYATRRDMIVGDLMSG